VGSTGGRQHTEAPRTFDCRYVWAYVRAQSTRAHTRRFEQERVRLRGEMAEVERVAMALEKQLSASAKQARHDKDEFESHVTASIHTCVLEYH
jgi:hypothetical protein